MLTYFILAYVNKNRIRCNYNTVVVIETLVKKVNSFKNVCQFCHNSCIEPGRSFYHFATPLRAFTVSQFSLVKCRIGLGEFRLPYKTYHTCILFFKRYVRTLTYSILPYAYHREMSATTFT